MPRSCGSSVALLAPAAPALYLIVMEPLLVSTPKRCKTSTRRERKQFAQIILDKLEVLELGLNFVRDNMCTLRSGGAPPGLACDSIPWSAKDEVVDLRSSVDEHQQEIKLLKTRLQRLENLLFILDVQKIDEAIFKAASQPIDHFQPETELSPMQVQQQQQQQQQQQASASPLSLQPVALDKVFEISSSSDDVQEDIRCVATTSSGTSMTRNAVVKGDWRALPGTGWKIIYDKLPPNPISSTPYEYVKARWPSSSALLNVVSHWRQYGPSATLPDYMYKAAAAEQKYEELKALRVVFKDAWISKVKHWR